MQIGYSRAQVNLSIVTWLEGTVFTNGEAGHLSFPIFQKGCSADQEIGRKRFIFCFWVNI
jgi:hypothetical protein